MSKEQEVLKLVSDFPNLSNREIGKVIGLHRATVSYYLLKICDSMKYKIFESHNIGSE